MKKRIERLRAVSEDRFLVTVPTNVRYLTGFRSTNAAVLVEPDAVSLFTDFRYAEGAREVEGVEVVMTKRSLAADIAERLDGRIAFEADAMPYSQYETLAAGGLELVPTRGVIEGLRAVKEADEIESIRRATEVTNAAFAALAEERFVGRTEQELAWRLESLLHEHGADAMAFPPVVAAGPNGARPHSTPGGRPVEQGETVVCDAGAIVDGYCSDCTRTFATGPLPDRLADAYELCLRAQHKALDAVRAGMSGVEADASARDPIEEAGLGEEFGHGLGHGVGLDIHELPRLSRESSETIEAGNVTSIEPGIYLPGLGGIRIEDLVVVSEDGLEVLTSFPKELVTVG